MHRLRTCLFVVLVLAVACQPTTTPATQPAPPAAQPTAAPPAAQLTAAPTTPPEPTAPPAPTAVPATPTPMPPMSLSSTAFTAEADIPLRHAQVPFEAPYKDATFVCPGTETGKENLSPALAWANVPPEAKSLVLIVVDDMHYAYPEAPEGAFFPHWTIYNIPPSTSGLSEGVTADAGLPAGALQGLNAYPAPYDLGYGGPCPGVGEKHLYIFTLYALNATLDLPAGADYKAVTGALEGHSLAQAELRGYFTGQ